MKLLHSLSTILLTLLVSMSDVYALDYNSNGNGMHNSAPRNVAQGKKRAVRKRAPKFQQQTGDNIQLNKIGQSALPQEFNQIQQRRAQDAATRFSTIKINKADAQKEIDFWSRQMSEHALFLHLGLEEAPLKERGMQIHNKFEAFRKKMNQAEILPLCKELRDYKIEVLSTLNSGKWIGWIFPQFARHIILELDYFVDKLNGIAYSDQDEVAFWNVINGEHAGFAAHLLDPSEITLFKKADKLMNKFAKIVRTEKEMLIQISLQSAQELDEYNKTAQSSIKANKVASVIHPVLIDHVVREGQRSIQTLNRLADTEGALMPSMEDME